MNNRYRIFGIVLLLVLGLVLIGVWFGTSSDAELNSIGLQRRMIAALPHRNETDDKKISDFVFYNAASELRRAIDIQVYPPIEPTDSAATTVGFVTQAKIRQSRQKLLQHPSALERAIDRLTQWDPRCRWSYEPGWPWDRSKRLPEAQTREIIGKLKREYLDHARDMLSTAMHAEYAGISDALEEIEEDFRTLAIDREWMSPERVQERILERDSLIQKVMDLDWKYKTQQRWHTLAKWKPEAYFAEPDAIAMARAIAEDDIDAMEKILASGIDINLKGESGMTFLLWGLPDHRLRRVECLLKHGADPNGLIPRGLLVNSSSFERGVGSIASFYDSMEKRPRPSEPSDVSDMSLLMASCCFPSLDCMELLLRYGADPNRTDKDVRRSALSVVLTEDISQRERRVRMLLDHNADPNLNLASDATDPLALAILNGVPQAVRMLLDKGATLKSASPEMRASIVLNLQQNADVYRRVFTRRFPLLDPAKENDAAEIVEQLSTK